MILINKLKQIKKYLFLLIIIFMFENKLFAIEKPSQNTNVKSEFELSKILNNSENICESITLDANIQLTKNLEIKNSCTLNLNGNTLNCKDYNIICGKCVFSHKEPYVVTHPGYFESKLVPVYIPGYWDNNRYCPGYTYYTTQKFWVPKRSEVLYEDIYNYYDNINITIENGKVIKNSGADGIDGKKNGNFEEASGKNGEKLSETITVISGILNLDNVSVHGPDGGKGGNGKYQKLIHIPFFGGGNGGNGGNGGDGNYAVYLKRKECKLNISKNNTVVLGGKGGQKGKGGIPNLNYWYFKGKKGKDGTKGKNSEPYNNFESIY